LQKIKGESVIKQLSTFVLALGAALALASLPAQAELQTTVTHHVRPATQNGEAKLLGRMPASQPMKLDIVLNLRDPEG
jgi:hypothetical protein